MRTLPRSATSGGAGDTRSILDERREQADSATNVAEMLIRDSMKRRADIERWTGSGRWQRRRALHALRQRLTAAVDEAYRRALQDQQ